MQIKEGDKVGTWIVVEKTDNVKVRFRRGVVFNCRCLVCGLEKQYAEVTLKKKNKPACKLCKKNTRPLTDMCVDELKSWQSERDSSAAIQNNGTGKSRKLAKLDIGRKIRFL